MTETTTTSGFSRDALERVAAARGDGARVRERAFAEFEAMPMPSPETEEWRYTDLRDLDLSRYVPYAPQPVAATLDDVDPGAIRAVGAVGERSGLAIQHNSTVVSCHLDAEALAGGGVFAGLDEAMVKYPDHLRDHLHAAVPALRTRFTAL